MKVEIEVDKVCDPVRIVIEQGCTVTRQKFLHKTRRVTPFFFIVSAFLQQPLSQLCRNNLEDETLLQRNVDLWFL